VRVNNTKTLWKLHDHEHEQLIISYCMTVYSWHTYKYMIIFHFCHNFAVPDPTTVMLSSSIPNPIPPFGSDVTLTCAVEFSPAVDVPVAVNTEWTGPYHGLSATDPLMESTNRYTSTATVSSFGRDQSGYYSCSASISSKSPLLDDSTSTTTTERIRVTTGKTHQILMIP
jgi:hypothetical protein